MLTILPVPILEDNYVWLGHVDGRAFVVDPGEAAPVAARLAELGLSLDAVLLTHHHRDHTGGVAELAARWHCPVFGPAGLAGVTRPLADGDWLQLGALGLAFDVLAVPGHTLDHLAYYGHGTLFCGDTLFACGCGRLFEGTPAQMQASLARLAALPGDTRVCCTHEYTLANERFAHAVEPGNAELAQRMADDQARRARGEPTLPSSVGLERATNPFLRWDAPAVLAAARAHGAETGEPVAVFAALRRWKDGFRG
ncbi:hydroxyacylglutathione hydrolase [Chitinimonas koreensis]|uniref:hydroxyacylglutathione hydrolase n=1 Tax=Chitinimonas koreensis TaxID=356302 RepID=UPI0003F67EE8|nr:hydroxyacylglutathione hydrolase [Chitinimonas koreensis]QNM97453.1 hydroxyacylglutathione hydrolase [Chitinimonas koreensis]